MLESLARRIDDAVALRAHGEQGEGISRLYRIRADSREAHAPALAALALHRKGDLLHDLGRDDEAEQAYIAAMKEHEARGDMAMVARAAHDLGMLKSDRSDEPGAEHWYREARAARLKAGDKAGLRKTDNNLAILFFFQSRFAEAEPLFLEAATAAEEIEDDEGAFKVHVNLALLHLISAEGGFPSQQGRLPKMDLSSVHMKEARAHFAKAAAVGARIGRTEDDTCALLGAYNAHCEWLIPGRTPQEGLARFYLRKAPEFTEDYNDARRGRARLGADASPEEVEEAKREVLMSEALLATLFMRTADALRAAGSLDDPSAGNLEKYEERARSLFAKAVRRLEPPDNEPADLCGLSPSFADLCSRFEQPGKKSGKSAPGSAVRP